MKSKDKQIRELSENLDKNRYEVSAKSEIEHYKQKIIQEQEAIIAEKEREIKLCVEKLKLAIENIDTLNDDIRMLERQLEKQKEKNHQILRTRMIDSERFKNIIDKNRKVLRDLMIFKKDIEHKDKIIREARMYNAEKEDMQNYFEDDELLDPSSITKANKLESSLQNVNQQLAQGLEMLKKDHKFIKSQLKEVSDEVDYLDMEFRSGHRNQDTIDSNELSQTSLKSHNRYDGLVELLKKY